MGDREEFVTRVSDSSLLSECSCLVGQLKSQDDTLSPSQYIEPDEAMFLPDSHDDVTGHQSDDVESNQSNVKVIHRFSHRPRSLPSFLHEHPLPPVMTQFVQTMVDSHWDKWKAAGLMKEPLNQSKRAELVGMYHFILHKAEEHLRRMIETYLKVLEDCLTTKPSRIAPPLHLHNYSKVYKRMTKEEKLNTEEGTHASKPQLPEGREDRKSILSKRKRQREPSTKLCCSSNQVVDFDDNDGGDSGCGGGGSESQAKKGKVESSGQDNCSDLDGDSDSSLKLNQHTLLKSGLRGDMGSGWESDELF